MAPTRQTARSDVLPLLVPLSGFIDGLPDRVRALLSDTSSPHLATLEADLKAHINTLKVNARFLATRVDNDQEWEKPATDMWNQSIRLGRSGALEGEYRKHSSDLDARVIATKRDLDHRADLDNLTRLFRLANKASKSCIDGEQYDLCTITLQKAVDYDTRLGEDLEKHNNDEHADGVEKEDEKLYAQLHAEYLGLRITLAWKQDKLELADNMFSQVDTATDKNNLDSTTAEQLADLLFEVGKSLFHKEEYKKAVRWLERSKSILSSQDVFLLSPDAGELKLSIMHLLGQALIQLKTPDSLYDARKIVQTLKTDHDDKMAVILLELDLLSAETKFDVTSYTNALNRLIRTVHTTDANCNTIQAKIMELKGHSPSEACRALDDFIDLRLAIDEKWQWVAKALVTRVWITIEELADQADEVSSLRTAFDAVLARSQKPLDAGATHAIHVLLWKRVASNYKDGQILAAEQWTQLARHGLFANAGELNGAILARKLLSCALERNDLAQAKVVIEEMPEKMKSSPLTIFLMYQFALQGGKVDLASECLEMISRESATNPNLLYACLVEAQKVSDKTHAIAALQRVLTVGDHEVANGAHVPALLRCLSRLLIAELPPEGQKDERNIGRQLCEVFETAATHMSMRMEGRRSRVTDQFSKSELRWFMRSSYNISTQYFGLWPTERSIRLLEVCIQFLDIVNIDDEVETEKYVLICRCLLSKALVKLARAEDDLTLKHQYYARAHEHASTCHAFPTAQNEVRTTMGRELIKYDFEACMHLERYDELPAIVNHAQWLEDQELFQLITDLTLSADFEVPATVRLSTLQAVIRATEPGANLRKLSRWLRVALLLLLEPASSPVAGGATERARKADAILSQSLDLAQKYPPDQDQDDHILYPAEEVEWLATTTFNRAIDAYCVSEEEKAQHLANIAVDFAECLAGFDGGTLREALIARRSGLVVTQDDDKEESE